KSSLKLMTLGAKHGDKLTIRAEGEDEDAAVEALVAVISTEEE
ncbi:MAG TPA: HPr family phosphocarrier protein, partial [Rubrobacteraceae bacterium]|nr:HPr family phosphocarrier protein [Rubrobacteraceae bacterium]